MQYLSGVDPEMWNKFRTWRPLGYKVKLIWLTNALMVTYVSKENEKLLARHFANSLRCASSLLNLTKRIRVSI